MSGNELHSKADPTILGILDTAGSERTSGGCQPYGLHLLADDNIVMPTAWMTTGATYFLRNDGEWWIVTGGQLAAAGTYRLTRDGRSISTVPTLFRDEPLDPEHKYKLSPIPGPEPAWLLYQLD